MSGRAQVREDSRGRRASRSRGKVSNKAGKKNVTLTSLGIDSGMGWEEGGGGGAVREDIPEERVDEEGRGERTNKWWYCMGSRWRSGRGQNHSNIVYDNFISRIYKRHHSPKPGKRCNENGNSTFPNKKISIPTTTKTRGVASSGSNPNLGIRGRGEMRERGRGGTRFFC